MTDRELDAKIATKVMGWVVETLPDGYDYWRKPNGEGWIAISRFRPSKSMDDVRLAEDRVASVSAARERYVRSLKSVTQVTLDKEWALVYASPRQRCLSLLMILGESVWVESKRERVVEYTIKG